MPRYLIIPIYLICLIGVSECGEKDFQKAAPMTTSTNQADDKTSGGTTTQDKNDEPAKKIAVDLDQDDIPYLYPL